MDTRSKTAKVQKGVHNNTNTDKKRARKTLSSSPETSEAKKLKEYEMTDIQASLNALQSTLKSMQDQLTNIQTGQHSLENKFDNLATDLQAHKINTKAQLDNMQAQIDHIKSNESQVDPLKNKIDQMRLQSNVTCTGIPSKYHNKQDDIIDTFNRTFNLALNRQSFKFIHTNVQKHDNSLCTLKMKFFDCKDKAQLMTAVNQLSRNAQDKWEPLVIEDVFEEVKDPPSALCGKRLSFFNTLTPANQQIIKMKHEVKPYILQERDGVISIKKTVKSATYEVNSKDDVREYVRKFKDNIL